MDYHDYVSNLDQKPTNQPANQQMQQDQQPANQQDQQPANQQDQQPANQQMQQDQQPPPYSAPVSRFRWLRKYKNQKNIQCCIECSCRTACLPCCTMLGITGCISTVTHATCHCLTWFSTCCYQFDCGPRRACLTNEQVQCNWKPYKWLDNSLDHWPICCLGVMKFQEERTPEEEQEIANCNECCYECISCPFHWCENCCLAFCNSKCVVWCKQCCTNACNTCGNCCCGCIGCMRLLGRRLCCIRPQQPIKQDMQ